MLQRPQYVQIDPVGVGAVFLLGGFDDFGDVRQPCVVHKQLKGPDADQPLADVRMPVDPAAQVLFGIV